RAIGEIQHSQAVLAGSPNAVDDLLSIRRPSGESAIGQAFGEILGLLRAIRTHHYQFGGGRLPRTEKSAESEGDPLPVRRPSGHEGRSILVRENYFLVGT